MDGRSGPLFREDLFFWLHEFSPPNGRLSPIACHTFLESLCISGQFRPSGNNFCASYIFVLESCWQITHDSPQHLRPRPLGNGNVERKSLEK